MLHVNFCCLVGWPHKEEHTRGCFLSESSDIFGELDKYSQTLNRYNANSNQSHLNHQDINVTLSCAEMKKMHHAIARARIAYHCSDKPASGTGSFFNIQT